MDGAEILEFKWKKKGMSAKRCLNEGISVEGSEAKHGHVRLGNIGKKI
jgi:hypothetical protein